MGSINTFPITTQKASEQGAVTTLDPSDSFRVLAAGLNKRILFSSLQALIGAQASNANLYIYAGITPSVIGQNILAQTVPTGTSYTNINHAGVWSYLTALQVVADLVNNGQAVDQATAQYLANKIIGGIQFGAGTSGDSVGAVTDIPQPSDTYLLRLIKVGYTGGLLNFRFTGSTDVTFPKSGVLATIGKLNAISDSTQAAAATLNLDSADGGQADVSGSGISITAVTLAENSTKLVRFTGVNTLVAGASLILPSGLGSIPTDAGSYATFIGGAGGVVTVKDFTKGDGSQIANISGGSIDNLSYVGLDAPGDYTARVRAGTGTLTAARYLSLRLLDGDRVLTLGGDVSIAGNLTTTGAPEWYNGTGSPEGVVTGTRGAIYTRTDGGSGTTLYVKESASGNTGWAAK